MGRIGIGIGIPGQGRAGAFTPDQIAGLQLWLRADAGTFQDTGLTTPAAADGDPVGGWQDQSGSGNHATQATAANKLALKLAIQNGLPVLRGNGTSTRMATPSVGVFPSKRGSVFSVARNTGSNLTAYVLATYPAAVPPFILYADRAGTRNKWYDGTTNFAGAAADTTSWLLKGAVRSGDANLDYFENGVLLNSFAVANAQPAAGVLSVGSRTDGAGAWLGGDFAEVLVYNTALAAGQRQQVESYLNTRWAAF